MHSFYLDAIRNFEGYTPQAKSDYAQLSNGYGTKAQFAGEVINRTEAERRFQSEVSSARSIVEKAAPGVDEGTKAALTSLTYNAGTSWIDSGLGQAVRRGDLGEAREIFQQYTKAGGEVLPGLVSRRAQEALWIGNPEAVTLTSATTGPVGDSASALPPVVLDRDQSALTVAEMLRPPAVSSVGSPSSQGLALGLERGPRVERVASRVAMASIAKDALVSMVDADRLASGSIADITRLATLGRGSELAKSERERQDNETRRI